MLLSLKDPVIIPEKENFKKYTELHLIIMKKLIN